MNAAVMDRPAGPDPDVSGNDGGIPARRAVVRWAWRLLRREWRQQLAMLALVTVAVAATFVGAAVATNTPAPTDTGFGAAGYLVTFSGSDPHLAADIADVGRGFGAVDVIENTPLATGLVQGAQIRSQDPDGPYGRPMLSLVSGHYPTGAGEVAMTGGLESMLGLRVGGVWRENDHALAVVGTVENPQNLLDEFALVAPGQMGGLEQMGGLGRLDASSQVTVLFDGTPKAVGAFAFPQGAVPVTPQAAQGIHPTVLVLGIEVIGLIFVGLVAVAGFTATAQRRLRALGMLSALGAADRNVRLVTVANGAAVGVVGALAGSAVGLAAWAAYVPRLSESVDHRVVWTSLPWALIGTSVALAVVTAILAALRPARAVAHVPVVAALSGRPVASMPVHRRAAPGVVLLAGGVILLSASGGIDTNEKGALLGGIVATSAGFLFLVPLAIPVLAVVAGAPRVPVAVRIALRDINRYRARSGPALAASGFAVFIAVLITLYATGRFNDPVDYVGPSLPSNELVVHVPNGNADAGGPGSPPGVGQSPTPPQESPAELQAHADAIAASLGSQDVLPLEAAGVNLAQSGPRARGNPGTIYLATPTVLRHYGIDPSAVEPTTLLVTSRAGLAGTPDLHLVQNLGGAQLDDPKIQTFARLPTGASEPNLLATPYAVGRLGLQATPSAWLVQTPRSLTVIQIDTARRMAASTGLTIETKDNEPTLAEVRDDATAAGILLALGMLAMTVGLIRGEAAGDLRTLTATGASAWTRRTITAASAGALGVLGAVCGTLVGYTATAAFSWDALTARMSNPPLLDLMFILVGMPVVAAVGGWLIAGRQPPAIAHQPLE